MIIFSTFILLALCFICNQFNCIGTSYLFVDNVVPTQFQCINVDRHGRTL